MQLNVTNILNIIIKICTVLLLVCSVMVLYETTKYLKKQSEIGRYTGEGFLILDTKTGKLIKGNIQ